MPFSVDDFKYSERQKRIIFIESANSMGSSFTFHVTRQRNERNALLAVRLHDLIDDA